LSIEKLSSKKAPKAFELKNSFGIAAMLTMAVVFCLFEIKAIRMGNTWVIWTYLACFTPVSVYENCWTVRPLVRRMESRKKTLKRVGFGLAEYVTLQQINNAIHVSRPTTTVGWKTAHFLVAVVEVAVYWCAVVFA